MVLNLYDQKTGKRKQKWIPTGYSVSGNKKKAEILLRETLNRFDDPAAHYNSDMLFSDYIEVWLSRIKAEIVATTYEGYVLHSKSVVEYFQNKKLKLTDLRAKHFSEFYNYQLREGKVNKRTNERGGYSVRTVRSQKLIINSALNMAVEEEIISRNPALQVRVTNKSKKKIAKEIQFFTGEELNEFLEKEKNIDKIYLYKIKLPKGTNYIAFSNIIFFDNKNMTLPLGMDLSNKILVDLSNVTINEKKSKRINKLEFEEDDDFSNIIVKNINLKEIK